MYTIILAKHLIKKRQVHSNRRVKHDNSTNPLIYDTIHVDQERYIFKSELCIWSTELIENFLFFVVLICVSTSNPLSSCWITIMCWITNCSGVAFVC